MLVGGARWGAEGWPNCRLAVTEHAGLSAVDPAGFNRIVPQTLDLAASKGTLHWKLQLLTCPTPQEAPFTSTPVRDKF